MIANKSNKAIVLIATIATLAVISVIVMFFAQSSMFERQIASNDNLERQAKLVATASIEWAASYIPKLAMGADERTKKDDGSYEINSKAYSSVADFYQFKVNGEVGYDPHCPVEEHYSANGKGGYTGKPSFYYENKEEQELPYEYSYRQDFDTNMVTLPTVHNKNSKVINTAPETEEIKRRRRWTVHSTLKCVDANAFWNINSPIDDTNADYKKMVDTLVSVILGNNGEIVQKWVEERGNGEFADLGDFRKRMSSVKSLNQKDLDKLCRYITVDSWGNEKSFKYGESYSDYNNDAPFEKRYPININVASKEILRVVFQGITTKNDDISINESTANDLAECIVKNRQKHENCTTFKTWNDVENYLYKYFGDDKDQAEAIFAVIYPGMLPHKKSPNRAQYRKFDKSDITEGTTECCLFSPGVFYCEAIGRVIEYKEKYEKTHHYNILSHSKVSVNMKLWEPYIVNSQSDFEWQRHKGDRTLATWSGIEGGYYPDPKDYPSQKDGNKREVSTGFLQEREFWSSENSTYPDACRYWSWAIDNPDAFEKRVDGVYMKTQDPNLVPGILEDAYNTKSENKKKWDDDEWKANKWQDDGFDLWIKPSYTPEQYEEAETQLTKPLLIAVKKEVAQTKGTKCYILTRCAYDFASTDPYLTISRTLVTDEKTPDDSLRKPTNGNEFRIFYNSTIFSEDKINKLYEAGGRVFDYFLAYVVDNSEKLFPHGDEWEGLWFSESRKYRPKFATDFADQVYKAVMEEDESVDIPYEIWSELNDWGHITHTKYTGKLRIFLPKFFDEEQTSAEQEKLNWYHAKIASGLCSDDEFILQGSEGPIYILRYIFSNAKCLPTKRDIKKINFNDSTNLDDSILYYGYVTRGSRQKEAKELSWFPGKNASEDNDVPIQTEYRYSRTESRISNIKLYKGCWYHIHARWESNKILITDFKIHYQNGKEIEEKQGQLYKHLFGSPGRVWALNDQNTEVTFYPPSPITEEDNKTAFYCNNCVISFSHCYPRKEEEKEIWRYWSNTESSIYTGNFNEGNSEDPSNEEYYNKFNLPKMWKSQKHPQYFYYGTVAWTQFFPKDKDNKTIKEAKFCINKNEKYKFYSWGEEENYPQNTIKPNSIFMKKYNNKDDDENAFFTFELKDNTEPNSSSHFETTIVDRVVLYMIVQPQPIHWSFNNRGHEYDCK